MHFISKIQGKEAVTKSAAAILILLLFFGFTAYAQPHHIVVGCGDFPPIFFQSEDKQIAGHDIDLWRLWSEKTGITVEFQVMKWNDVIPALLAHEIDVANGATHTPERAKIMAFTQPHEELLSYLFFHKNTYPLQGISDLAGKTVGVLKGSNVEEYLSIKVPDATVIAASNYEALVANALEERTQVFIAEDPLVSYYISKINSMNKFKRSLNPILDSSLSMAVRLEDKELLYILNQGFDAITEKERQQIDDKWFGKPLHNSANHGQWYLWIFLVLGMGTVTAIIAALMRTWRRELPDIHSVRIKFVNIWILAAGILCIPLLFISLSRSYAFGWLPLHSLQVIVVIFAIIFAILRNYIHYHIRTLFVLSGLYLVGLGGLLTYGIVGATQLPLMTLVIVSALLFGMKGVGISVITSLATIGSVAVLIQMDMLVPSYDIAVYATSLSTWSVVFSVFAFYTISLGFGIAAIYQHMEDALHAQHKSESLFRNLVETTSDLLWETDINGNYVYCSPQIETILGYTQKEILGKPFSIFMPPDEKGQLTKIFREFSGTEQIFTAQENANLHKDGHRVILETSGTPVLDAAKNVIGYRGVARDVTKRKEVEAERERLMFAVEQAAESIIITDVAADIQYVNPAFGNTTGYERDETIGKNLSLLKSGAHDSAFYKKMWKTLSGGSPWSGQIQNKKKDGTLYTGEVVISPVRDSMGIIVNYIAVQRDITNEITLEAQLRQAQKMEAVGQLAGGVAHDFNNLLQVILGYSDLAIDEVKPEDPVYNSLSEIIGAGKRASTLVRQLLAFSRRQVLEMSDVDLNEIISNLTKMVRRVIGENIILDVRDDLELGTIHADTGQVEQVLMNLCVNARDAMPDGGTITIKTENVQIDKVFSKEQDENIPPGCYICLSTSDTGCGMHEKTCKNIFDPFFTTKEVGKGTGLGLATVYGIVKQHEGFIQVQSEVDKGTTFSIYLPRVDRTAARVIVEEKKIVPSGTETILIAEDDRMVCRLSETVLKRSGYTVLTAADGKEAWELFQKHADDISLILLDVIMPKLSGLAVFERVREVHPDILVLFSSGYSIDTVHAGVVFNDRTQMIQKPYHPDALLRKVRQVLDSSEKDHK